MNTTKSILAALVLLATGFLQSNAAVCWVLNYAYESRVKSTTVTPPLLIVSTIEGIYLDSVSLNARTDTMSRSDNPASDYHVVTKIQTFGRAFSAQMYSYPIREIRTETYTYFNFRPQMAVTFAETRVLSDPENPGNLGALFLPANFIGTQTLVNVGSTIQDVAGSGTYKFYSHRYETDPLDHIHLVFALCGVEGSGGYVGRITKNFHADGDGKSIIYSPSMASLRAALDPVPPVSWVPVWANFDWTSGGVEHH
jgi:hypothetical protein